MASASVAALKATRHDYTCQWMSLGSPSSNASLSKLSKAPSTCVRTAMNGVLNTLPYPNLEQAAEVELVGWMGVFMLRHDFLHHGDEDLVARAELNHHAAENFHGRWVEVGTGVEDVNYSVDYLGRVVSEVEGSAKLLYRLQRSPGDQVERR